MGLVIWLRKIRIAPSFQLNYCLPLPALPSLRPRPLPRLVPLLALWSFNSLAFSAFFNLVAYSWASLRPRSEQILTRNFKPETEQWITILDYPAWNENTTQVSESLTMKTQNNHMYILSGSWTLGMSKTLEWHYTAECYTGITMDWSRLTIFGCVKLWLFSNTCTSVKT